MTRLHCARYVIPLHRPWWLSAWRYVQLAWLRYRRQCVIDEMNGYREGGMELGPLYVSNCRAQIDAYSVRIAMLECWT